MHVVATNLAIWIATIADETAAALMYSDSSHTSSSDDVTHGPDDHVAAVMLNDTLGPRDAPKFETYTGFRSISPVRECFLFE